MPYGTDSFTDRYGDYKQPTVIEYDKDLITVGSVTEISKEEKEKYKSLIDSIIKNVLTINPFFAKEKYQELVLSKDNKVMWNKEKLYEMSKNLDWLFNFKTYLDKCKNKYYSNNNL